MSTDFYILGLIQRLRCGLLDIIMPIITYLGNGGIIWAVAALIMCIPKKSRKTGIMVLCGLLIGFILCSLIIKPAVSRPRPCWIDSSVALLIETPRDYSFPSGHTLSSFVSAFILTYRKSKLGYPAMALASLIAFSRLYLYVHFPSDILGGLILAAVCAAVVIYGERKISIRANKNKTTD